jgi:hypothetical protein
MQAPPPAPPAPPAPPLSPFEPPPVGSYSAAPGGYSSPSPPASSEAIAALVCGIFAWGCFPLGFLALWLGARARRAARENPNYVGGEQLALAGMIIGGGFVALNVLILFLYAGVVAVALGAHLFK